MKPVKQRSEPMPDVVGVPADPPQQQRPPVSVVAYMRYSTSLQREDTLLRQQLVTELYSHEHGLHLVK